MMHKKGFGRELIIVLLVLLIFVFPVQGYTEIASVTVTSNTTSGAPIWSLLFKNVTKATQMTRATFDIQMYYTGGHPTGTYTGWFKNAISGPPSTGNCGEYTATWSCSNTSSYAPCNIEILTQINGTCGQSGTAALYLDGPLANGHGICYGLCSPFRDNGGTTANVQINQTGLSSWTSDDDAVVFGTTGGTSTVFGVHKAFSGTALPDAPVINDFTVEKTCYVPNESAILTADVTGTVDTWNWKIYDGDTVVSETSDPVETVTGPLMNVTRYGVKLTVSNAGGVDDYYKSAYINVTQAGECNFTPYNPFPTITTTPTQNVFVTMTMPPSVVVNISGVNQVIDNSYLGNMSAGYRSYIDGIGEGVNTTMVGAVSILQSPFSMLTNAIAEGVSLFSVSINSLMSYTTIPLAIVGITLTYYPWQIITLITAGIAVDAFFVLIFGVR